MPAKMDPDGSPGVKLLRFFRTLLVDSNKHYQADLAAKLHCSPQTILRMASDIERVIGTSLESGLDNRRRWYRIVSNKPNTLGLEFEELRYLSICRDLATPTLPAHIRKRVDDTILTLSVMMHEQDSPEVTSHFAFFTKGRIDYAPHYAKLETLLRAMQERRVCLVKYKASGKATVREHRFAPDSFISMSQAIYATGALLSEDFSQVRHFTHLAVHRMQAVATMNRYYEGDFPKVADGTFGLPWHEPREYHIHFRAGRAADYVSERIWADQQQLETQEDGSVILHITTRSEPELMAWVRSFGDEASLLTQGTLSPSKCTPPVLTDVGAEAKISPA
ncbi:MAG: WYL domain-containing protein [Desulfovibrio sp.]|nr:WYL domain-containing protein [Desulfovibrio sp.]